MTPRRILGDKQPAYEETFEGFVVTQLRSQAKAITDLADVVMRINDNIGNLVDVMLVLAQKQAEVDDGKQGGEISD